MPVTRWHVPAPVRASTPRHSPSTTRCSTRDAVNPDWLLGKSQALMALGRPREALPLLERARRDAPAYEDPGAQTSAPSTSSMNSTPPTRCSRRPPYGSRNPPGRASGRWRCANGACRSAAPGFQPMSATRNSPATAPRGREPRSASTIVWASTGTASPACTSRSASTPATNSCSSAIPHGSATPGRMAFPVTSRPTRRSCPSGASPPTRAAPCRTPGESAFACDTRATQSADVDTISALLDKYVDAWSIGYSLNAAKTTGIDDPSFGHLLRVAREYGDSSRAALVVGFGEEAETVAPGVVQVTDEEHRVARPALDQHGLGHRLGGGLVRTGRSLRPIQDPPWTRTPVLNSSSRWPGAAPRSRRWSRPGSCCCRSWCGATTGWRRLHERVIAIPGGRCSRAPRWRRANHRVAAPARAPAALPLGRMERAAGLRARRDRRAPERHCADTRLRRRRAPLHPFAQVAGASSGSVRLATCATRPRGSPSRSSSSRRTPWFRSMRPPPSSTSMRSAPCPAS